MTFESVEEVIKLLKQNQQVPSWVKEARKEHKKLKALIYGEDYTELLLQIEHIESEKRALARRRYSKSIIDFNERMLKPLDNVYSATGGTKIYDKIASKSSRNQILNAITHIRDGKSLEKFLQTFWIKDLYSVDPAGVLFLEYDTDNDILPHPTYKSIDRIRNYQFSGQNLEWIIFEPKKIINENQNTITLVRVVDDLNDYAFKVEGDSYTLIEELSFEHPFGKTPGLINSNILRLGNFKRLSFIDDIVPIEEEVLRDKSVLTIYKFLNGFATPVRPAVVCPSCRGVGKKGTDSCPDCSGKGIVLRKDVTDEINLPISLDKDEAYTLPNGAFTYMSPPLDIWDQYNKELQKHEDQASDTLWGTHKEKFTNERTAFETYIDAQPVMSKLAEVSEVAEFMEWQFTEWIVNYFIPTKPKDEQSVIITYGKNFIIEPADSIMEKYRTNKKEGVSIVVLDRQLTEYITTKYKNNPRVLHNELIKKDLDYYVHYSTEEVNEIFGAREAQKKMLFTDWWETVKTEQLDVFNIENLKKERDYWVNNELERLNIENQNISQNE